MERTRKNERNKEIEERKEADSIRKM